MNHSRFGPWLMSWLALATFSAAAANYNVVVGGTSAEDLSFEPKTLTINVGDSVTWQWAGNPLHPHNVVAWGLFRCSQGCDGEGGNGNPSNSPWTFTRTFASPGTIDYYCDVHRVLGMTGSIVVSSGSGTPSTASAVEYYYADWNYYFETAFPAEIAALDGGAFGGVWKRTGETFNVWPSSVAGSAPTCRFFSTSFSPKSSHFYTPFDSECEIVKTNPSWQFESIAFYIAPTDANGQCPAGTSPLYRLYNDGMGGAPNHRYTTSRATVDQMRALGWLSEGNGPDVIFACVP